MSQNLQSNGCKVFNKTPIHNNLWNYQKLIKCLRKTTFSTYPRPTYMPFSISSLSLWFLKWEKPGLTMDDLWTGCWRWIGMLVGSEGCPVKVVSGFHYGRGMLFEADVGLKDDTKTCYGSRIRKKDTSNIYRGWSDKLLRCIGKL